MAANSDTITTTTDLFSKKYARWIILALFLATTLIFFSDVLFGKKFLWDDVAEYTYPLTTFAARSTIAGEIPYWNPYTFSGMPLAADFQVQYFYPPHTLLFLFLKPNGTLPIKAIEWVILLHFVLAQFAMYLFCRSRDISGWGSLIAAISWGFCGSLAVHTIHPMALYQLAYFPLILMHFHKGIFQRSWKSTLYSGLFLGLAVISGHPQTSTYILLFLAAYGAWNIVAALRAKKMSANELGLVTLRMVSPVVIAVGLVAIQFFPAQELASLSERSEISYEKSADGSMQPKQWFTAIVPNLFGAVFPSNSKMQFALPASDDSAEHPHYEQTHYYWDTAFYFGIAALLLGLYGATRSWNTSFGGYLLAVSGFALLYGLGKNGFVHEIFYGVPIFGSFRNPGRMMFYVGFAFSIFAALGFDALAARKKNQRDFYIFLAIVALPLFIALLAASGSLSDMAGAPEIIIKQTSSFGMTALLLVAIVATIGILLFKNKLNIQIAGAVLVLAAFVDLSMAYSPFSKGTQNPTEMYKIEPSMKEQFEAKNINDLFRVSMRNNHAMAMQRNQGPVDRIMLYEGYNPILLQRRSPLTSTPEESSDLLGIRYALQTDPATGQTRFAERQSAMPHARMVYEAIIASPENVEKRMAQGNIDYRQTVVIEKSPGIDLPQTSTENVHHNIECLHYSNNSMEYRITTEKPGILCLSEIWYPAWKAEIDGAPTEILRSNYSLRAAAIPAGTHTITFRYDSELFNIGRWTTIGTLIIVAFGLILTSRRKSKTI